MTQIAYVNGRYVLKNKALVHIDDRGYQFSDGVYEVIAVMNSHLIDIEAHLDRLNHSLSSLNIDWPCNRRVVNLILKTVLKRNHLKNGIIYLQITRGVAQRIHEFPSKSTKPSLIVTAAHNDFFSQNIHPFGAKVVTIKENRWSRRDIKSVSLLPNVLNKQFAIDKGAYEAWMVDEKSQITEGASTNAWIVNHDDQLVTRPLGPEILGGITRMRIIDLALKNNLNVLEKGFTLQEAQKAKEAFLTSTTSLVMPVIEIDGVKIGNGKVGNISQKLLELYKEYILDN